MGALFAPLAQIAPAPVMNQRMGQEWFVDSPSQPRIPASQHLVDVVQMYHLPGLDVQSSG